MNYLRQEVSKIMRLESSLNFLNEFEVYVIRSLLSNTW